MLLSHASLSREVVEALLFLPQLKWLRLNGCQVIAESPNQQSPAPIIPEIHRLAAEGLKAEEGDALWSKKACNFSTNASVQQLEDCVVPFKRSQSRLDISYATIPQDLLALLLGRGSRPIDAPLHLSFQAIIAQSITTLTHLHLTDDAVLQHLHLTNCYHLESVTLLSLSALITANFNHCFALKDIAVHECPALLLVSIESCTSLPPTLKLYLDRRYHIAATEL